jgi:hypothetical protein
MAKGVACMIDQPDENNVLMCTIYLYVKVKKSPET